MYTEDEMGVESSTVHDARRSDHNGTQQDIT